MTAKTEAFDYRESHTNHGRGTVYDGLYREGTALAFYWQHFEKPYLEQVFSALRARHPKGRYLDFACGTGRILQLGASYFADAVGVDVSDEMLVKARHKVPGARIVKADVLKTRTDLGRFDVVTLFRFLLRAGELREPVLRHLRGLIAEGGTLIVNNHRNAFSLRGMAYSLSTKVQPNGFEDDLLTDGQVEALLHRAGFAIVQRYSFGVIPSVKGQLLLPPSLVRGVERMCGGPLRAVAKNRIYICRPVPASIR
jgi:SAM-dependent methyltransferase